MIDLNLKQTLSFKYNETECRSKIVILQLFSDTVDIFHQQFRGVGSSFSLFLSVPFFKIVSYIADQFPFVMHMHIGE